MSTNLQPEITIIPGTVLKHYKGGVYEIYDLTNQGSQKETFPPSASYRNYGENGDVKYSRALSVLQDSEKYTILKSTTLLNRAMPEQKVTADFFVIYNFEQAMHYLSAIKEIYGEGWFSESCEELFKIGVKGALSTTTAPLSFISSISPISTPCLIHKVRSEATGKFTMMINQLTPELKRVFGSIEKNEAHFTVSALTNGLFPVKPV